MPTQEPRTDSNAQTSIASPFTKVYSLEFWQTRLRKRRTLDYSEIGRHLEVSPTSYKNFITWAKHDNQIVKDLVGHDNVIHSIPSRDALLQEIIWTFKTRQILFRSMMSDAAQPSQDIDPTNSTKTDLQADDGEMGEAAKAIHEATQLEIEKLQQCLGAGNSIAMTSPTVLGELYRQHP
ncbi:hypothetical protein DL98DRAFT_591516 [Cadophora sp. DSE1049]|nr:hypothetical protein DL98DRAFT_591516 [Cadophora sp. DSE1049]